MVSRTALTRRSSIGTPPATAHQIINWLATLHRRTIGGVCRSRQLAPLPRSSRFAPFGVLSSTKRVSVLSLGGAATGGTICDLTDLELETAARACRALAYQEELAAKRMENPSMPGPIENTAKRAAALAESSGRESSSLVRATVNRSPHSMRRLRTPRTSPIDELRLRLAAYFLP